MREKAAQAEHAETRSQVRGLPCSASGSRSGTAEHSIITAPFTITMPFSQMRIAPPPARKAGLPSGPCGRKRREFPTTAAQNFLVVPAAVGCENLTEEVIAEAL